MDRSSTPPRPPVGLQKAYADQPATPERKQFSRALLAAAGGVTVLSVAMVLTGSRPSRAARMAGWGAALLAGSVLADSGMEHYRGDYRKQPMKVAPLAAALTLLAAVATATGRASSRLKAATFAGATLTGLVGLGFHCKNILSRPGGLTWNNLFYRAPFGAPGALVLAGGAGLAALRADAVEGDPAAERRVGRLTGLVTALGLFGLTSEVGLLHFRGAFQDKVMYAPVVAVPLTGMAMATAAVARSSEASRAARLSLMATMGLGIVGTFMHAYGISRNNGGFANWTQNLFAGPPIAAPPSLLGIGLLGLSAIELLDRNARRHHA